MTNSFAEMILMVVERDDGSGPRVAGDADGDLELQTLIALAHGKQLAAAAEEGIRRHIGVRGEAERGGE